MPAHARRLLQITLYAEEVPWGGARAREINITYEGLGVVIYSNGPSIAPVD